MSSVSKILIYFYLDVLSNEIDWVCPHRLAGWTFNDDTGLYIEARTVSAAGHGQTLNRSVGEPHAIVRAHIINGEELLADVKNRQAFTTGDDRHPLAFREVR